MKSGFFHRRWIFGALAVLGVSFAQAQAEPQHGIAMYGDPVLPPDFVSLPYANPDAPKGGRIVFGEPGSYDSLNPHVRKGRAPWGVRIHVFESLMGRNWDEPFTLYGLLAESVETGPNREWVEFTLRPEAQFSDGSPVTVEDVLWSFETLGTVGHPRYLNAWKKIESAEATGERTVRFTFNVEDRELPLIMGLRPILKKAQYHGVDFAESGGIDIVPIGSSPYPIAEFDVGNFVSFRRNPDYWGNDLGFNRGRNNLDEIRYDFFGDGDVVFEAFKAGETSSFRESNAAKWDTNYSFPAISSGDIVQNLIPHQRPSGIKGFVMNTRLDIFSDWRVREAMIQMFNFEFVNESINGGREPRITSYFSNSILGMSHGAAKAEVMTLLDPFSDSLLPGALDGYDLPESDGSTRNRANTRRAVGLFEDAGWSVQNGVMTNEAGQAFGFEIVLSQGATQTHAMIDIYAEALATIGIVPNVTIVDSAQYKERTNAFDFGMAFYQRSLSLSPGNEQTLYWGSDSAGQEGSRNWMGVQSPAIDAMIQQILTAENQEGFRAATRALDRVLTTGRYVIPIWHSPESRLAHSASLHYPDTLPMYGDWIGFQPDVWWWEE